MLPPMLRKFGDPYCPYFPELSVARDGHASKVWLTGSQVDMSGGK